MAKSSKQDDEQPQEPQADEPQSFEQHHDERGRLRLDRPFTPEEAAAQDTAHREAYSVEWLSRFEPPLADRTAQERREAQRRAERF